MSATTDSEFYAEVCRRQRAIEGTITGYKAKLAECERELEECLETLQQWRSECNGVYPVLILPTEITAETFVHCLSFFGS